uniref:uncharacterized protein LOC122595686 n=1 Tax=Erigeron canadensis TaxID=72917 RepID=UPI001CB8D719|nr:uncharacterized protein LOC122595686 [Erigeron canadensis]
MGSNLLPEYVKLLNLLSSYSNIPYSLIESLRSYGIVLYQLDLQNTFSAPMPWIGMYIALGSLVCILAMVADLIHGFRNKSLLFPCRYFTLNAASLSVIACAMKLPMDLNNSMPGNVDRVAKIGSMAFMCTMMANSLPSLTTMSSKELLTNIIALSVLVITMIVNVGIQIKTGVLSNLEDRNYIENLGYIYDISPAMSELYIGLIATIYLSFLLILLILHACSSLVILKSKEILESKYQAGHETAKRDQLLQQPRGLTVEKLKQRVTLYWIMAGNRNPQFLTACFATICASGVVCGISCAIHCHVMGLILQIPYLKDYRSDYKWSMLVICIIQFIGVIIGTVAPGYRYGAALRLKLSTNGIWSHIMVFKVEKYWTQKLYDWKQSSILTPFPSSGRRYKIATLNVKIFIYDFCIGFQKAIVVTCKMISLIPVFYLRCVLYCLSGWNWLTDKFSSSCIVLVKNPEPPVQSKKHSPYVLQLEDDMEFVDISVKSISESVNSLIQKSEKQKPYNLMKLLVESRGFDGVEKFDSQQVPPLLSKQILNCWSLPVVTMTTIAISLSNIQKDKVDKLLSGVSEGLVYVSLVQECLNSTDDHTIIQKAAKLLWVEVELYQKWLGYKLDKLAPEANTTVDILKWFSDTSKNMVNEVNGTNIGDLNDNLRCRSISANSMYRITETIRISYQDGINEVSQEELFALLSVMISEILAACLTNIPQVIARKCHASAIEKREASVHAAAQLLGETSDVINSLQEREFPSLNSDEIAFIDHWRDYFMNHFP